MEYLALPYMMKLNKAAQSLIFSVTGLILLYQPFHLWFLAFVCLVPVIYCIQHTTSLLTLSARLFLVFFCWHLGTISSSVFIDMQVKDKLLLLLFFNGWYSLLMLLPVIAYRLITGRLKTPFRFLLLPLFWSIYEYLLNSSEFGMPLLNFNNAFNSSVFLSSVHRFCGPYFYVWFVWCINYLVYLFVQARDKQEKRKHLFTMGYVLGLFFVINGIAYMTVPIYSVQPHQVAVIQPDFKEKTTLDAEEARQRVKQLGEMSSRTSAETELIIWHESAVQGYIINQDSLDADPVIRYIRNLSLRLNKPILTGTILYKIYDGKTPRSKTARAASDQQERFYDVYNAAILITPDTLPIQQYYKNKLVPFVERLPYIDYFPVPEAVKINIGAYYPSFANTGKPLPLVYKAFSIAPLICSEGAFVDYAGRFSRNGANIFVVISNEGWTGKEVTSTIFSNLLLPVSATFNKTVIKCSNNGESFIRDFSGKTVAKTGYHQQAVMEYPVYLNNESTPYEASSFWLFLGWNILICRLIASKESAARKSA